MQLVLRAMTWLTYPVMLKSRPHSPEMVCKQRLLILPQGQRFPCSLAELGPGQAVERVPNDKVAEDDLQFRGIFGRAPGIRLDHL